LRYSVLALGDSSYADFCEMGRRLDARLSELGARRVVERSDCDLDFDDNAEAWTLKILETAQADAAPARGTHLHSVSPTPIFTRRNPFRAEILTRQRITGRDSSKDVRHVELDLEGSGLRYTPGDSLGVIASNPPQVVEAVIDVLGFDGDTAVGVSGQQMSLREALASRKEITRLSRPVLEAAASGQPRLQALLADRGRLAEYFNTRQLIDFIAEFEVPGNPGAFVGGLRTLTPRLYSIASSSDANPDEAHLTVAVVDYDAFGRRHLGAASNFLVGGITHAPVYVEHNEHFRLPADGNTPIAMIGAGTGVAPYRAFIEHRREHGHTGDNWLLFGDRTLANDFLYQIEWLRYRKDGLLTQLDVAFSRDQAEKIYVQHRMLRRGRQLFDWLERGAHVYVCGDAEHMAGDVHDALLAIVREHGGLSSDRATEYLGELKKARRYQRDVY
jgi:sulfite reductase (NADPH) flavoprotein alpha-component